jgi:dienelactone hydrolase
MKRCLLIFALVGSVLTAHAESPTLPTVNAEIRAAARAPHYRMLFEGDTPEQLTAWQEKFAAKLNELIGPYDPPKKWSARPLDTQTFPDFVREELLLSADGVPSLPLYLLRPVSAAAKKFPIVLCLHGHGPGGHDAVVGRADTPEIAADIQKHNYDYGRQLVRRGYLVVAPCFTPFGRRVDASLRARKDDPCAMVFARLMVMGRTTIGENLRDARWALDYAASRPEAIADRMGCVGLSYGGRMTMMTAALDKRIQVAAISGAQNIYEERLTQDGFCGSQVIPGLTKFGDIPEIGSLIAPRPVVWETGSQDKSMPERYMEIARQRITRAYAAAGQPDAVSFHTFDGGHSWDGTTAFPLLDRVLKAP